MITNLELATRLLVRLIRTTHLSARKDGNVLGLAGQQLPGLPEYVCDRQTGLPRLSSIRLIDLVTRCKIVLQLAMIEVSLGSNAQQKTAACNSTAWTHVQISLLWS